MRRFADVVMDEPRADLGHARRRGRGPGERAGSTVSDQTGRNKQAAMAFYDLMFNRCRPAEAVERYVGDRYVQHNPVVPDGKDGSVGCVERMARDRPGKARPFRACLGRGRLRGAARAAGAARRHRLAGMGSLRFENGNIAEHWNVLRRVPQVQAGTATPRVHSASWHSTRSSTQPRSTRLRCRKPSMPCWPSTELHPVSLDSYLSDRRPG